MSEESTSVDEKIATEATTATAADSTVVTVEDAPAADTVIVPPTEGATHATVKADAHQVLADCRALGIDVFSLVGEVFAEAKEAI